MSENLTVSTNNKKSEKKIKKLRTAGIVVAVIAFVVILVSVICYANADSVRSQLVYTFLPKSVDLSNYSDDCDIVLYVERNADYDSEADETEPLKKNNYYYYDEDGNKVTLAYDDKITVDDNEGMAYMIYYLAAFQDISAKLENFKYIIPVVLVILVVALIFIWYSVWSKNYDKEKEKLNAAKHTGNKKKKKKQ
ncbi:MAG: hypothetical protein LUG95_01995 [Clostridiales bacterium]|nr:hypothetical protein [Clostridiales bacterium]